MPHDKRRQSVSRGGGKRDGDGGADAWRTGERHRALVRLGDALADRKAETCAAFRAGARGVYAIEAFSEVRQMIGVDADTGIFHTDGNAQSNASGPEGYHSARR